KDKRRRVVLRPVKILARELTRAHGKAFIRPSLFQPPGIEAERIFAGHAARTGQQAKICTQVASCLPKRSRMEIQSGLLLQRAKIDVDRASDAVPARQSLFLLALDVP